MSRDLYRLPNGKWGVSTEETNGVIRCNSADEAAIYLEEVGVPADEIDVGLIHMVTFGNSRAHFGDIEGCFISSDKLLPHDA